MKDESTLPAVLRRNLPPHLDKIKHGKYSEDDLDYPIHLYLKENDIRVNEDGSDVIPFFRGKSVLVTGATGFLGKLLVEKLLRCCKDIDTIFIIVRNKKGKDAKERVKEFLDNWVFVKLSEIYPEFRDKIVGISGDFAEDGAGLSGESRKILTEKVNIIYHVAATIRFDENLKTATKINIKGLQEIIKIAKECKKLDVFTHMSSAFSNCRQAHIKEEFYTPLMDPDDLVTITDRLSSDVAGKITSGLLGDAPNTYVFTKQIAEEIVRRECVGLPACIQRPSIVIATTKEPIRSWVDNIYGPVGLIEAACMGLLHVMLGDPNGRCDMVPADYVVNNCIVASYKTAKERKLDQVPIFNYTVSSSNPIVWKNLGLGGVRGTKVGSTKILVKGFCRFTRYWYLYLILNFVLHTIPGTILDFISVSMGKKPQLTKAYSKISKFVSLLSHFTLNEWTFESKNTVDLWHSLNEKDKAIFSFDMATLDWANYFDTYVVAMREFLIFEFLDNLDEGRTHIKRVFFISNVILVAILLLSIYFCIYNIIFCFIPITFIGILLFYFLTDHR